jgi:hypothetical protein
VSAVTGRPCRHTGERDLDAEILRLFGDGRPDDPALAPPDLLHGGSATLPADGQGLPGLSPARQMLNKVSYEP